MSFWKRWRRKRKEKGDKKGEDRLKRAGGSWQAQVIFQDGRVLKTEVGASQGAVSYAQVVEQIANAGGDTFRATEVVLRNVGTFDAGWWDYLDDLIAELERAGRADFARQGINTGKFITDQLLMYGSWEQLLMASRWWNRYLVAEIVELLENLRGAEKTERAIHQVLSADSDPADTYRNLLAILSKLDEQAPYKRLQRLTDASSNWLDQYFFEGISAALEKAQKQGKRDLAWRCFAAGAIAGATVFNHGVITLLARAKEFLTNYPEQRYATRF